MFPPRSSVFLERQNYRRRRLIDWIKILPIVGLVLWFVPLLWQTEGEERIATSSAIIYFFAVWFILVIAKAISAIALKRVAPMTPSNKERGGYGQS